MGWLQVWVLKSCLLVLRVCGVPLVASSTDVEPLADEALLDGRLDIDSAWQRSADRLSLWRVFVVEVGT
jgi:hypothetical protein